MRTSKWLIVIGAAAAIVLTAAATAGAQPAPQRGPVPLEQPTADAPQTGPTTPDPRYGLQRGDVLELNFPLVPSFNQTITVQPDGYVTLHALGPLHVDGMTVPELTKSVQAEYASILRDPVVTIELKDFEKPYFTVAGEVVRPGKYDLRGETTATQALAVAGGITDRAKHSEAVLFRRLAEGGFRSTQLDLKKMLKEAELNADLRLRSGDMLFIPRGRGRLNWGAVSAVVSSLWVLSYLR